jgi:hypothetical protein
MGLISIFIVFILKYYIFPELIHLNITVLEDCVYTVKVPSIIFASIAGLFVRLGLEGVIDWSIEDFFKAKMPLGQVELSSEIKSVSFAKDNGEGSSKNTEPTNKGGIIGPEDYSYDTDTDSEYQSHEEEDDNKATGDGIDTFKKKVENMTNKENVAATKEEVETGLGVFKTSGMHVPSYQEQLIELEKKLEICKNKMSELDNKEQLESKDKGKGKEVAQETTATKRVATDNPGPTPKRVANPNYQPVPGSHQASWVEDGDYLYDSDAENRAILRAMEESMKTDESKKGESSKSEGKGKGKDE